jgi:hypothetical protein
MLSTAATSLRTRVRGRWGLLAGVLVALGAVVLLVYPYGSGDDPADGVAASRVETLSASYLTADASFSADPLLQGRTTPLLVVTPTDGGRRASARVVAGARVAAVQHVALPGVEGEPALVPWSGGRLAVASLERSGPQLHVRAAALTGGRRIADLRVRIAATRDGAVDVRLAPWRGPASDLFVLAWPRPGVVGVADRATGTRPLPRLSVLDGDADFARTELRVRLPLAAPVPAQWTLLVARVSGPVPDLVLLRRAPGRSPEVHVLSGESGFQQFILHERLALPNGVARRSWFVPALERGRPVLRAIEPGAGRATVRVFPLGAAVPGA